MRDPTKTATVGAEWLHSPSEGDDAAEVMALAIVWSATEPQRVGEVALIREEDEPQILGRGDGGASPPRRIAFFRQRPGTLIACPAIQGPAISHEQVRLQPVNGGLEFERVGRCAVLVNGQKADAGQLRPGETLSLKHQLVLLCCRRPAHLPTLRSYESQSPHRFGAPDPHGMVGETPVAWELREQLAFAATSDRHALLVGESGCGKELAAQCMHALSRRAERPLVSRNAATFPAGIIDAELFGNVKDYPNPGMEARPGLIGQADGGTLFLDEIAELPPELQGHLLRVLDGQGEYQRLGDAQVRRSDLRIVAATNRDPADLKHDLLARLTLRVEVPGLACRREDIALLVRHVLHQAAADSPEIESRFFTKAPDSTSQPRIDPALIDALVRHRYTHHVRELETLLWEAISHSTGSFIALTEGVAAKIDEDTPAIEATPELTADAIRACLRRHDGKVSRAWRELGLNSRYALYRLMKKHGIEG